MDGVIFVEKTRSRITADRGKTWK